MQQRSRAVAVLLVEERPRFRPALEALLKFVAEDSLDPARGGVGDRHGDVDGGLQPVQPSAKTT